MKGIEPSSSAWKAEVLPLNYTRMIKLKIDGREDRIRTCDPLVPNQVLYQAELLPVNNGAPERSRTPNLLIRSQTLYPIELRAHLKEIKCRGPVSNRHGSHLPQDFKSCASANSATPAYNLALERKTGFEPATPTLARWCSTTELLPHISAGEGSRTPTP